MDKPIQVAICDSFPIILAGLQHLLNNDPNIRTTAVADKHQEILQRFADKDIDVMLYDIEVNELTYFNYLREFLGLRPNVKTIIYTGNTDKNAILEAIDLGVQGYQLKQADCNVIIDAIHTVYTGGTSLAPSVATTLMEHIQNNQKINQYKLSKREQEVLGLIAKGKSNGDIAEVLSISVRTVKFHVSAILSKLNVKNRTQAAIRAI